MSKFLTGQSGNPNGRPQGIKDRRTLLAEMLAEHRQQLINKSLELALGGDIQMLRFFLDRLIPKPRSETISVDFSEADPTKAEGLIVIGAEILKAVTSQIITPEQGKVLADIVETQRKNIEVSDLAARVAAVEATLKHRKSKV